VQIAEEEKVVTGKELIALLKKQDTSLPVRMFNHDQDDEKYEEGLGEVQSVRTITNNAGEIFISLRT
jgi:hypothetical protein